MANPLRGEAPLKVGDVEYTLVFDINAMCEAEEFLDLTVREILSKLDSLIVVRGLIWAGLRAKHAEVTVKQAGAIIEAIGGADQALEVLGRGLTAAFPEGKEGEGANPPNGAAVGTGRRSSKRGQKRA